MSLSHHRQEAVRHVHVFTVVRYDEMPGDCVPLDTEQWPQARPGTALELEALCTAAPVAVGARQRRRVVVLTHWTSRTQPTVRGGLGGDKVTVRIRFAA